MKLIIEDDEGRKTVVPVVRDEITIGRNDENLVRLTEKNVSRKHGRLLREAGHFYVEDLNSFTGIRVNGEKIAGKHLVQEGDLIQISEYDLTLQAGPGEKKIPPAALGADEEETLPGKHAAGTEEAQKRRNEETATIRLSDLKPDASIDAPQENVPELERPRLVGISGTYRGRELVLHSTPIRLGRSDENDIAIDHPSISRRHLRLHLSGGTWKVMDAESRNGVRVNGEPYAQIGLRHGDVVEIGHLRFAFVEPARSFKLPSEFAPMAAGVGPVALPPRRTGLYALIGLVLVAAAGATAFSILRHREEGENEAGQDSRAERKFALRAADAALAGHRYTEALRHLDVARQAGAGPEETKDYAKVQAEARSEELYREMESAASSQDWERARKLLNSLASAKTWYGVKGAEKSEAITAGYVNLHIAAAGLMKGKDNAGCLSEAQLALQANPASSDAQSLVEACKGGAVPAVVRSASLAPRPSPAAPASRAGDD